MVLHAYYENGRVRAFETSARLFCVLSHAARKPHCTGAFARVSAVARQSAVRLVRASKRCAVLTSEAITTPPSHKTKRRPLPTP
eukprot:6186331-Pleurochrysis_carterae.AAC.3